jgi:hypothetical protein
MPPSVSPSWGSSPFGSSGFGGGSILLAGGNIPFSAPFDVYNVHPGGEMAAFSTYIEVEPYGIGGQLDTDPLTGNFLIGTGGPLPATTTHFRINKTVPETFTFEAVFTFGELPHDFSNISLSHAFIGVIRASDYCFGLFFSLAGISYTGSVLFDGLGNLNTNSPVQLLPNSVNVVEEGIEYILRVCVDSALATTYIYVTKSSDLLVTGHQLRYVLPAFDSTTGVFPLTESGTYVSARGKVASPVGANLTSIALGTGLLIPNLPPVADAGKDQGVRTCSIARLDGRASFDPEGVALLYKWRLIDAPDVSGFLFLGEDGSTYGGVLTNKFHSAVLQAVHNDVTIVAGDVLSYNGVAYDVAGTGTDINGFYVLLTANVLPPGLTSAYFRFLKQNAVSGPNTAQPTFFPDVQGIFRFDLMVSDGALWSAPSNVILNVTDSPIPRGIIPDLSFLWNYLSDFWKLVDNTEVIETFWGALAQIAASELLTLWQHDYSKSLRDIQRTFQRRWLHYDLFIREPFPELTKVNLLFGGVYTALMPSTGAPAASVSGDFTINIPDRGDFTISLTAPSNPVSIPSIRQQLAAQLAVIDKNFIVSTRSNFIGTKTAVSVTAPFPFSVSGSTSAIMPASVNTVPQGTGGAAAATNIYVVGAQDGVNETFSDLSGVAYGDALIIDGISYTISQINPKGITGPGDRILTLDPLPINVGSDWYISKGVKSSYLDFYTSLCAKGDTAVFEVIQAATGDISFFQCPVLSASSFGTTALHVDLTAVHPYLAASSRYTVLLFGVHRRAYMPLDPLVSEVPTLQEYIRTTDDTQVLRQNVDYYVDAFRGRKCLRFVISSTNPEEDVWLGGISPNRMWADTTFLDNRPTIEANFGITAGFTLDNLEELPPNVDYLSVVRGLWYSYFNGPTLANLRTGTQILLGLPFAEEKGTIEEIRTDFSVKLSRLLIKDASEQGIVRSYTYPSSLDLEINPATQVTYKVGDTVELFAPLVKCAEVIDYVKDPKWFEGYLNQGVFLEVDKFFRFLVRVDSSAFSLNTLIFVKNFINKIKPTYTYPLYVVLHKIDRGTTVDITTEVEHLGTLYLNEWPCSFNYDNALWGHIGGVFEDPRPAYGGWRSRFDSNLYSGDVLASPGNPPVYPNAVTPIYWGFDRRFVCPEDIIYGVLSAFYPAPFLVTYDGLFTFDKPTFTAVYGIFEEISLILPAVPPGVTELAVGPDVTSVITGTMTALLFEFQAVYALPSNTVVNINVYKNGLLGTSINLTLLAGTAKYGNGYVISLPVTSGDTLGVTVSTTVTDVPLPAGAKFFVAVGEGNTWAFNTPLPAGTYQKPVMM